MNEKPQTTKIIPLNFYEMYILIFWSDTISLWMKFQNSILKILMTVFPEIYILH